MNLRLPASGSLVEVLFDRLAASPTDPTGSTPIENVTDADVLSAIDAMQRGDIEYVILENGDEFLQAAGEGNGPYALEVSTDTAGLMVGVRGGVDAETMRKVFLAYLRRDPAWRGALEWKAMSV